MKYIFIFYFFVSQNLLGQINLTQLNGSEIYLNPAFSGGLQNKFRVTSRFKRNISKNSGVNNISLLSFENKLIDNKSKNNDFFSYGIYGANSTTNKNIDGTFVENNVSSSVAYTKVLNQSGLSCITLSFQYSFLFNKIEKPTLIFESTLLELANAGLLFSDVYGNAILNFKYGFLSTGLLYHGSDAKKSYKLGFSIINVNKTVIEFEGGSLNLKKRFWNYLEYENKIDKNSICFNVLIGYYEKSINDLIISVNYKNSINQISYITYGAFFKKQLQNKFISPMISLIYKNIAISFSHDLHLRNNKNYFRNMGEICFLIKSN